MPSENTDPLFDSLDPDELEGMTDWEIEALRASIGAVVREAGRNRPTAAGKGSRNPDG